MQMCLLCILLFLLYQSGCDKNERWDSNKKKKKANCASYGKVAYKMKEMQESFLPSKFRPELKFIPKVDLIK